MLKQPAKLTKNIVLQRDKKTIKKIQLMVSFCLFETPDSSKKTFNYNCVKCRNA